MPRRMKKAAVGDTLEAVDEALALLRVAAVLQEVVRHVKVVVQVWEFPLKGDK